MKPNFFSANFYLDFVNSHPKALFIGFKWLVFLLSLLFIYFQFDKIGSDIHWNLFQLRSLPYLIFTLVLLPINWIIEAKKWRKIISKIEIISLRKALKAVLIALPLGFLTPNRLGELPGRTLLLKPENRFAAMLLSSIGALAHLLILLILSLISVFYFELNFSKPNLLKSNFDIVIIIIISLLVILCILVLKFGFLFQYLILIKGKFKNIKKSFSEFNRLEIFQILNLSLLRFLVYCTQFYFLLLFYQVKIEIVTAYFSIFLSYFLITIVPSFFLSEIGIRGAISIFVMQNFSTNITGIAAATFTLWIINVLIPSCIGLVLLLKQK